MTRSEGFADRHLSEGLRELSIEMSIQALVWVIEYSQSHLADRCVLVSIANHCDRQGGNAWPSVDTISHEAKVSHRQVQVSIVRLGRMGELRIARNQGPHGTNLYGLPKMTEGNPALLAKVPEAERRGAESAGVQNLRGALCSSGLQNPASKRQNSAPEPSFKPSLKPSSDTPGAPIPRAESVSGKPEQPPPLPEGALIPKPDPWGLVKKELKRTMNPQSFETWIPPTRFGYVLNHKIIVLVPNSEWEYMRERFGADIKDAMKRLHLPYNEFALKPASAGAGGSTIPSR